MIPNRLQAFARNPIIQDLYIHRKPDEKDIVLFQKGLPGIPPLLFELIGQDRQVRRQQWQDRM